MIIAKTPHRVSLFGGGSDFPEYFVEHGGAVLGFGINKYIHHCLSYLPEGLFDYRLRLAYSVVETANCVDEVKHSPFREIIRNVSPELGYEIHVSSDLPAFSGLGSSSSFSVGLINLLNARKNVLLEPKALAKKAIHLERNILAEKVGWQDQIFAAHGGLNVIEFKKSGAYSVSPIVINNDRMNELMSCSLLVHTGIKRRAQDIEKRKFGNIDLVRQQLLSISMLVDQAEQILVGNGTMAALGELLNDVWRLKRSISDAVSNSFIDNLYSSAIDAGAWGGKLLGAGGGGCLFFLVPPERRTQVINALGGLSVIDFGVSSFGSKIVCSDASASFDRLI